MKLHIYKIIAPLLALVLLVGVAGCQMPYVPSGGDPSEGRLPIKGGLLDIGDDSPDSPGRNVAVRRIEVTLDSYEIVLGETFTPSVTILPSNATDTTYTLESDDDSVLRVMGDGFIAVGGGTADIVATASNGVVGWASVTVVVPVRSLSFDDGQLTLNIGESSTLTPVIYPENTTISNATFSSSNENVATVNQNGVIRAISAGTAVIECAVDSASASITVTVVAPVTNISIVTNKRTYIVGEEGSFTVTISPDNATDSSYTVTISEGGELAEYDTFVCTASGELFITVSAENGISARHTVSVIDIAAFANEVHNLTNIERANAGLTLFARRARLTQAAELRAEEIIRSFSHTRPDGRSCFTAFDESNVVYRYAGENLAMGQRTPEEVVKGWMDSPGHRENILNSNFERLGIGIVLDANGIIYWTQTFTD